MLRARNSGQFCPGEAREGCSRDTWISGTRSVKSENKKMRLPNDWWASAPSKARYPPQPFRHRLSEDFTDRLSSSFLITRCWSCLLRGIRRISTLRRKIEQLIEEFRKRLTSISAEKVICYCDFLRYQPDLEGPLSVAPMKSRMKPIHSVLTRWHCWVMTHFNNINVDLDGGMLGAAWGGGNDEFYFPA